MKYKQAIRIDNNITEMMKIPCVRGCFKNDDKNDFEWLLYQVRAGADGHMEDAKEGDWLIEDEQGVWRVETDCQVNWKYEKSLD